MPSDDQFDDFYLLSRLRSRGWLLSYARYARDLGLELTVEDDKIDDPVIRVTDLAMQRYIELPVDSEDDQVEDIVRNFNSVYAQLKAGDDDGLPDELESLSHRIVDILIEALDPEEFVSDFSRSEEKPGGWPIHQIPTGKEVLRAVVFETGHKLYVWKTEKRREHYGTGRNSFILGYRLVAPNGRICAEGEDYHPGGFRDVIGNESIGVLVQGLSSGEEGLDDEDVARMTPVQLAWLKDPGRENLSSSVEGYDPSYSSEPLPWEDLPGYEYNPEEP